MADENNQDMSMEDILSSIKNILEDDVSTQQAPQAAAADDDILELSSDMRLDAPAAEPINLDAELDSVPLPELGEEQTPAAEAAEPDESPRGVNLGWEDFESDPFYEEPAEHGAEETAAPTETAEMVEPAETEMPAAPEPVVEIETEQTPEPVVEVEPEPEPEPVVEAAADSAVDVSASIISNFAKMFTHEEPAPEPAPEVHQAAAPEPVKLLGDGAKTIEDVVCSVIRQIIGEEVAANWRNGLDYEAFAKEEIARQTAEWLDRNLPAVVETVVKQEIERVMVKAGTNQ